MEGFYDITVTQELMWCPAFPPGRTWPYQINLNRNQKLVLFYLSIQRDTCMGAIPMSCDISIKFRSLSALESDGAFPRGQSTVSSTWGFAVSGARAANSDICLFEVTHHPVRAGIDCPYEKRKIQANNFLKMYPSISNTSLVFAVSLVVIMLTHC